VITDGNCFLTLCHAGRITEGVIETILRRDIAQLSDSGLSLTPEGLESAITVEQMADLIAFLAPPLKDSKGRGQR